MCVPNYKVFTQCSWDVREKINTSTSVRLAEFFYRPLHWKLPKKYKNLRFRDFEKKNSVYYWFIFDASGGLGRNFLVLNEANQFWTRLKANTPHVQYSCYYAIAKTAFETTLKSVNSKFISCGLYTYAIRWHLWWILVADELRPDTYCKSEKQSKAKENALNQSKDASHIYVSVLTINRHHLSSLDLCAGANCSDTEM